ncbi:hypothetical protein B566_EDAN019336, partial [Ephemera danica]
MVLDGAMGTMIQRFKLTDADYRGVMVPAEKILDEAIKQNVDIIGLSGLITPSLDEMVYVAKEMEKRGMKIPLLIGGATTSRVHTAVKIDPHYSGSVVYVLDASKSVPVASNLLSPDLHENYKADVKQEYVEFREEYANKQTAKNYISLTEARKNKLKIDWENTEIKKPTFLGTKVFENYSLKEIAEFIDWTPFFQTWDLHGRYPKILTDSVVGEQATQLLADAKEMLATLIQEKWLKASAVIGFWPTNTVDEDTQLIFKYEVIDEGHTKRIEDVLLNRREDAADRLLEIAEGMKGQSAETEKAVLEWRFGTVEERITHALVKGVTEFVDEDTEEARQKYESPLK